MSSSSIPAFKAALETRLAAALSVTVTYGPPKAGEFGEREWVWLGGARSTQETAAMGQRRREEVWTQDVIVSCVAPARDDHQVLTERAFEISGDIEDSLRAWSAPGSAFDAVVRTALLTGQDLEEFLSVEERESRITVRITCTNRI